MGRAKQSHLRNLLIFLPALRRDSTYPCLVRIQIAVQLRKTLYQESGQFERIFLIGNPPINLPTLPEPGKSAIPGKGTK
jgi:hypothetical protein